MYLINFKTETPNSTLKYRNLKAFLYVSVNYRSTFETHL